MSNESQLTFYPTSATKALTQIMKSATKPMVLVVQAKSFWVIITYLFGNTAKIAVQTHIIRIVGQNWIHRYSSGPDSEQTASATSVKPKTLETKKWTYSYIPHDRHLPFCPLLAVHLIAIFRSRHFPEKTNELIEFTNWLITDPDNRKSERRKVIPRACARTEGAQFTTYL